MILRIPKTANCDWYTTTEETWHDVIHHVENPTEQFLHKDDVPLWAFYKPVASPAIGYYGLPKFYTENFEYCYALLLDFDNDGSGDRYISVDDAIKEFKDFQFVLYTSYRHSDEHHKFRMVVPLARGINHRWFRSDYVKKWFINKFSGVDVKASIKSLQKHKVPAVHPEANNYRYHVNHGDRLALPLEEFYSEIEKEMEEARAKWKPAVAPQRHDSIFSMSVAEIEQQARIEGITRHHERELAGISWDRGAGNDVHGNLCRIAYSLQKAFVEDWYEIIMRYAPYSYAAEVRRMEI